jgi:hypothetical protein
LDKYYKIISLKKGKTILVKDNILEVYLNKIDTDEIINNDEVFKRAINPDIYFWVSGGGSFFINKKYIFLVKRSSEAIINPNKFSIFTGRSNNIRELKNPLLLARELFEELLLTKDGLIYFPKCGGFQNIIDNVYQQLEKNFFEEKNIKYLNFDLSYLPFLDKRVKVVTISGKKEFHLDYYINNNNDINILFLFSGQLDISNLYAFDGEYFKLKNAIVRHSREVYLYDIFSSTGRNITVGGDNKIVHITEDDLTEQSKYYISNIKNENNY